MKCRVCSTSVPSFSLTLPAPGLSSLTTSLDAPTEVAICRACSHAQSPSPVELTEFYDNVYKISLQSDDFDQLHSFENGKPIFRTDRQLQVLLDLVDIRENAKVLDYGCAKAQSLRRLVAARPDIMPHAFDVSEDYREQWRGWLPDGQTATYKIPESWHGQFDLVTAYFVLEHVEEPTEHLRQLAKLLAPDGRLFVIVPDSLTNSGDILIIDHVNKFSRPSLQRACQLAGLEIDGFDRTGFTGSLAFAAHCGAALHGPEGADVLAAVQGFEEACALWGDMQRRLSAFTESQNGKPLAVHGAGFYGSFVMQQIRDRASVVAVLDNNPHLQGGEFFGCPVVALENLPDACQAVIVALNPSTGRKIVGDGKLYGRNDLGLFFLDGAEEEA